MNGKSITPTKRRRKKKGEVKETARKNIPKSAWLGAIGKERNHDLNLACWRKRNHH